MAAMLAGPTPARCDCNHTPAVYAFFSLQTKPLKVHE
jgi:hypothetical protein